HQRRIGIGAFDERPVLGRGPLTNQPERVAAGMIDVALTLPEERRGAAQQGRRHGDRGRDPPPAPPQTRRAPTPARRPPPPAAALGNRAATASAPTAAATARANATTQSNRPAPRNAVPSGACSYRVYSSEPRPRLSTR